MKQVLFSLTLLLLSSFHFLQAKPTRNPYEETTWNVIRERLFNGENAKAYRFEDDIRLQVSGLKTQQDSIIITQMISELNPLLETIQIKLVNTDPNFKLAIMSNPNGSSSNYRHLFSGSEIVM